MPTEVGFYDIRPFGARGLVYCMIYKQIKLRRYVGRIQGRTTRHARIRHIILRPQHTSLEADLSH